MSTNWNRGMTPTVFEYPITRQQVRPGLTTSRLFIPVRFGSSDVVNCVLDTGASHSVIGFDHAVSLGLTPQQPEHPIRVGVAGYRGEVLLANTEIGFGPTPDDRHQIAFAVRLLVVPGGQFRYTILGLNDLLPHFRFEMDTGRFRLILRDDHGAKWLPASTAPVVEADPFAAVLTGLATPPEQDRERQLHDSVMRDDYPGQYVAYRDHWAGNVLRRDILATSPRLDAVHDALTELTDADREQVRVTYCDDPDQPQAKPHFRRPLTQRVG